MMLGEAFPRRRGGRFGKFAKGKERAIVVVPLAGAALSILPRYNTRSPARPSALSPSPFFFLFLTPPRADCVYREMSVRPCLPTASAEAVARLD